MTDGCRFNNSACRAARPIAARKFRENAIFPVDLSRKIGIYPDDPSPRWSQSFKTNARLSQL
jgi:hypothetical protein